MPGQLLARRRAAAAVGRRGPRERGLAPPSHFPHPADPSLCARLLGGARACDGADALRPRAGASAQIRGDDNQITSIEVPQGYDGPPVMVWNDGDPAHTKVFIAADSVKDDFAAAARVDFSKPAGVAQELALPVCGAGAARAGGVAAARPSPAHLSLSCHALALATWQGLQKGDFDSFNSDAAANAAAVTPVGAFLLQKHLGPDRRLVPRPPHPSSDELDENDAPSEPSTALAPMTARRASGNGPSVPHAPWHPATEGSEDVALQGVMVRTAGSAVEYHL